MAKGFKTRPSFYTPLERKIPVVCAANIGRAVALTYSSSPQKAGQVVKGIEAAGGKALAIRADSADEVTKMTALGRYGQDDEVAGMVSYLASPEAAFVTGARLRMDGDLSA